MCVIFISKFCSYGNGFLYAKTLRPWRFSTIVGRNRSVSAIDCTVFPFSRQNFSQFALTILLCCTLILLEEDQSGEDQDQDEEEDQEEDQEVDQDSASSSEEELQQRRHSGRSTRNSSGRTAKKSTKTKSKPTTKKQKRPAKKQHKDPLPSPLTAQDTNAMAMSTRAKLEKAKEDKKAAQNKAAIVAQENALLKAKLAQLEPNPGQVAGTPVNPTAMISPGAQQIVLQGNPHKQKGRHKAQNQGVLHKAKDVIKNHTYNIWRTIKFVSSETEQNILASRTYDALVTDGFFGKMDSITDKDAYKQAWLGQWEDTVLQALNETRQYCCNKMRAVCWEYMDAHNGQLPELGTLLLCVQRKVSPGNATHFGIFCWYVDKLLPAAALDPTCFGPSKRYYQTVSSAFLPGEETKPADKKKTCISFSTEAFALVVFDGCRKGWMTYHSEEKAAKALGKKLKKIDFDKMTGKNIEPQSLNSPDIQVIDIKVCSNIYSDAKCGQAKFGGWIHAGLEKYTKYHKHAKDGRKDPNCLTLEQAALTKFRKDKGLKAATEEEERASKKRKCPTQSAPKPVILTIDEDE